MLPELVRAFLVFLIVQGLKGLGRAFGFDISGAAAVAAAALVAAISAFYGAIYAALPEEWRAVADAAVGLIAAVLMASGFHYTPRSVANALKSVIAPQPPVEG